MHASANAVKMSRRKLLSDDQHITDAWLNSHFNDLDSLEIRGYVQALEVVFVKMLAAGKTKSQIKKYISKMERKAEEILTGGTAKIIPPENLEHSHTELFQAW